MLLFRQRGQECIPDEMTFEQRPEVSEGVSLVDIRQSGKSAQAGQLCTQGSSGGSRLGVLWKQPGGRGWSAGCIASYPWRGRARLGEGVCSQDFEHGMLGSDSAFKGLLLPSGASV